MLGTARRLEGVAAEWVASMGCARASGIVARARHRSQTALLHLAPQRVTITGTQ